MTLRSLDGLRYDEQQHKPQKLRYIKEFYNLMFMTPFHKAVHI